MMHTSVISAATKAHSEKIKQPGTYMEYISIKKQDETAPHVLTASSSLMGICFVVLTSIKLMGKTEASFIDDIAGYAIALFMTSCIFSFLSFRINGNKRRWFINAADSTFMLGLLLLFATTMLFSFDIIK